MKCSRFSHRRRNVFASAAGWAPVVDELQNDLLVTDDACTSTICPSLSSGVFGHLFRLADRRLSPYTTTTSIQQQTRANGRRASSSSQRREKLLCTAQARIYRGTSRRLNYGKATGKKEEKPWKKRLSESRTRTFWPFALPAAAGRREVLLLLLLWVFLMNDVASLRDLMTFGCPLPAFEQHLNRSSSNSASPTDSHILAPPRPSVRH
ncbi:hypothetical protein DAPPUDRAFT_238286 [Daphnia pulex]|uniref:Uncharacterized protein n=1 Tax=Daphnia pulex TaxID=6669 RepID=E9G611_DAPPU|nr:hypothetical protein DAPPUDRAFT_238286 [Daphnia pulex]|eukprot:EFX84858.1 hypothetical protein DAPPUDRAFT_238286 [Daphnia pulex]